jgi:hypothetical protein
MRLFCSKRAGVQCDSDAGGKVALFKPVICVRFSTGLDLK